MPVKRLTDKGFSLVEIIIVIAIMAVVIGVVGTLLAGYTRMFNETDDQAVARQRAQDVFNALEVAVVGCALGIPTDSINHMNYFDTAPISAWTGPLQILNTETYNTATELNSGNVLRLAYSVPADTKNGNARVSDFTPSATGTPSVELTLTKPLAGDLVAYSGDAKDTRKFITFANAYTSPLKVTNINGYTIKVTGMPQPAADAADGDLAKLVRGEIAPYQDVHLVRAIAAYVDSNSVFHAAEVNETDVSVNNPTGQLSPPGLRVEGIKAVWFETTNDRRLLTVKVLAEGEIVDQARLDDTLTRDAIKARWGSVKSADWDDRIFYADFAATWRIRNYAPN